MAYLGRTGLFRRYLMPTSFEQERQGTLVDHTGRRMPIEERLSLGYQIPQELKMVRPLPHFSLLSQMPAQPTYAVRFWPNTSGLAKRNGLMRGGADARFITECCGPAFYHQVARCTGTEDRRSTMPGISVPMLCLFEYQFLNLPGATAAPRFHYAGHLLDFAF
ncbi:hypothetical protein R3P38DRAFT_2761730 [Favolaschia claudopus]|uniref:Uncharacterized protein n=1 Tax=Favolaschia claudopus TaxID=2862362 RepID=A0AAW0DRF7_9AGAR